MILCFYYVLVIWYVDSFESLYEVDVILQLLHRDFQTLLVGFLRQGVGDKREALVLMMQLIPVRLQPLDSGATQENSLSRHHHQYSRIHTAAARNRSVVCAKKMSAGQTL